MRQLFLTAFVVTVLSSIAFATPPGQYRLTLTPTMISSSSPGGDFSALLDEQLDLNDKTKLGYFVADMERAGPYSMMAEAIAVANGDPTMIGYLTSNSLGAGFPKYVRNFNANFLALPALPSKLLPDVSSNPAIVVRTIETPKHGTWYALVNTGMSAVDKATIRLPGGKVVESAVSGERLAAAGVVQASFYPFELKAWRVK